MKTKAVTALSLLIAVSSAFAVFLLPFTSWDDLVSKSPDIIIGRGVTTPAPWFSNGQTWSDLEVQMVLKGDTKPGAARMVSQYWPHQGDRFLILSTYQSNHLYQAYNATEAYRVVPLGRYFQTNELVGKPLNAQIQLLLRHRLEELTRELQEGSEEKKRLEEALKK